MMSDEMWDGYPKTLKHKGDVYMLKGKTRPDGERGLYRFEKIWLLVAADLKKKVTVEAAGGGFPKGSWFWAPRPGITPRVTVTAREASTAPTASVPASGAGRSFRPREPSLESQNKCADDACLTEAGGGGQLRAPDGHYHSRVSRVTMFPESICCRHVPRGSIQCNPNVVFITDGSITVQAVDKTRKRRKAKVA